MTEDNKEIFKDGENSVFVRSEAQKHNNDDICAGLTRKIEETNNIAVACSDNRYLEKLADVCVKNKADIYVFDPDNPDESDSWNCLAETLDDHTERLDINKLKKFMYVLMNNICKVNQSGEDFWADAEYRILAAAAAYTAYRYEQERAERYAEIYHEVTGGSDERTERILREEYYPFSQAKSRLIGAALKEHKLPKEFANDIWNYKGKNRYDLESLYQNLMNFENILDSMRNIPEDHPAYKVCCNVFEPCSDHVIHSASACLKKIFKEALPEKTLKLLSEDGIKLSFDKYRQTALFIIAPKEPDLRTPFISLMITCMIENNVNNYDSQKYIASLSGKTVFFRPLTVVLDDISKLGVIAGDQEKFGAMLSLAKEKRITTLLT